MPVSDSRIQREQNGNRATYRLAGSVDRAVAWALRDDVEHDVAAEVVLDFSLVREFSDLAIAVLAYGLTARPRRVGFRGLRQHQLRIFRYCGVPVDDRPDPRATHGTPIPTATSERWVGPLR